MRLAHNLNSLNIYREHVKILDDKSKALERISTGKLINKAGDAPNTLIKSESMNMQIRGLQMAQKNVQDGTSMLQTAEGGLNGITEMLQRVKELVVKAQSDSNTDSDRGVIQTEVKQMLDGIDKLAKSTTFNGTPLLTNETDPTVQFNNPTILEMPVGANVGEIVHVNVYNTEL